MLVASGMEDEVLEKYQKKHCWSKCKNKRRPVEWVYKKGQAGRNNAGGRERTECLVALVTECNRVCKQIVSEEKKTARDGVSSS